MKLLFTFLFLLLFCPCFEVSAFYTPAECQTAGGTCKVKNLTSNCSTGEEDKGACVINGVDTSTQSCCKSNSLTPATPTTANFDYTPIETIPGQGNPADLGAYIKAIYLFALFSVGIAALIMVMVGAFVYITAAGNSSQTEKGKEIIKDALLGILVAFGAWLILFVINPDLVKIDLRSLSSLGSGGGSGSTSPGSPYNGPSTGCGQIAEEAMKMVNGTCAYNQDLRNHCQGSPAYTDCSMFVSDAYTRAGCTSPGSTTEQMYNGPATAKPASLSSLKAGDAIVYRYQTNKGEKGHVVVCLDDGCPQVAAAAGLKRGLVKDSAQSYFDQPGAKIINASQFCSNASATNC